METNPFVEPAAPLPPDEGTPQTTSADNPSPEPATPPVSEIATEAAAAEALPEPLVEVSVQSEQPETPAVQEAEPHQEESSSVFVSDTSVEEIPNAPAIDSITDSAVAELPEESQEPERTTVSQAELAFDGHQREDETSSEPVQATPGEENKEASLEAEVTREIPTEGASTEGPQDALAALANHAQTTRLSPAEEERATTLLKESILDGRAGVARAVEALPKLPWVIGVNAVTSVWPELKPAFRSQLLAGLVRTGGDPAKRMRLSLARGLFKQDVPIALKIIVGAAKEMRNRETGAMSPKHAQIFANVLIGRAKPWIAQLPLADVKPNDADILVHCALLAAFSLPHAPITQLGIIKWAAEAGRLSKLHQTVIDAAQKSLGRWSGKWQSALRKEVPDLPEGFTAVLKVSQPKEVTPPVSTGETTSPVSVEPGTSTEEVSDIRAEEVEPDAETEAAEVISEGHPEGAEEPDAEVAEALKPDATLEEEEDEDEDEEEDEEEEEQEEAVGQPQPKPRPVYESKTVPRKPQHGQPQPQQQQGGKGGVALKDASVPELLRHLESQFQSLRTELQATQGKLRQRDEDLRRIQKKVVERASAPMIEGEPTPEELARLNRQLESRNQELQARIEELLADSEARAVSVGAVSGEPVSDPNTQLRTLLGLKIQEDYEDFLALEKESPDIVVQQYYRTVLRHVFEVLTNEGVHFDVTAPDHIQGA